MNNAANPLAELTIIEATDGLLLPTLFYEPLAHTKRAVIWLHGMGSSGVIYSTKHTNALARAFVDSGTAFIAMQNRGAGMLQSVKYFDDNQEKQRRVQGTSHELIAEAVYDIDGAVAFAKKAGYTELYLAGHSTGANKVALYSFLKPENDLSGYVLYGGGDDTGLFYEQLGKERFKQILTEAKQQVKTGHGEDLAPVELLGDHFSYQSVADILDPDGGYNTFPYYETLNGRIGTKELWREVHSMAKPTLVVYGELDEYAKPDTKTAIKILRDHASKPELFTFRLIASGDHGCYQHEDELAQTIAEWVARDEH